MSEQKTHWKRLYNPNYLGAWSFAPGQDMVLTVDHVTHEEVSDSSGRKEQCMVVYFREQGAKPMVCNKTNAKSIEALAKSPYLEDWPGTRLQLYVDHNVRFGSDRVDGVRIRKKITLHDAPTPMLCESCGKTVTDVELEGKRYAAATIVATARKRYGKCLCMECYRMAGETSAADPG